MILICFIQIQLLQHFVVRDAAGTCDHITPNLASVLFLPIHVRSDVKVLLMTESKQSRPFLPQISYPTQCSKLSVHSDPVSPQRGLFLSCPLPLD